MRFIVVARSLREGESISDVSSIAHTQEWINEQKVKAEGVLTPTAGELIRADGLTYIYLDQEYSIKGCNDQIIQFH